MVPRHAKPLEKLEQMDDLTPEIAGKILEGDDLNLIKRVRSGKPLSKFNRDKLEAIRAQADPAPAEPDNTIPETVTTVAELCRIVECDRKTLWRWRKMPDFPGGKDGNWPARAIKAFADQRRGAGRVSIAPALTGRKLELEIERLEIQISLLRGETIYLEHHIEVCDHLINGIKGVLTPMPSTYAPQIVGIETPEEGERVLETVVAECFKVLSKVPVTEFEDTATKREKEARTPTKAAPVAKKVKGKVGGKHPRRD